MKLPEPVAVGYFPKVATKRPGAWTGPEHVDEICSVSHCIHGGPDDWIDRWLHNELGFFPTSEAALTVAGEQAERCPLFAYRLFPLEYENGEARAWNAPLAVELELDELELLGFDPVSRSQGSHPECSPLSCNLAANDFPVNRHCLLDALPEAHEVCRRISAAGYEPGPYYLFEVYRKIRPG